MWLHLTISWTFLSYTCMYQRNKKQSFYIFLFFFLLISSFCSLIVIRICLGRINLLNIYWDSLHWVFTFILLMSVATLIAVAPIFVQQCLSAVFTTSHPPTSLQFWWQFITQDEKMFLFILTSNPRRLTNLAQTVLTAPYLVSCLSPAVGLISCGFNNQPRQSCLIRGRNLSASVIWT